MKMLCGDIQHSGRQQIKRQAACKTPSSYVAGTAGPDGLAVLAGVWARVGRGAPNQICSILAIMATRCSSPGSLGRNAGGTRFALAFCRHAAGCTCKPQPLLYQTAEIRSGAEEASPGTTPAAAACGVQRRVAGLAPS